MISSIKRAISLIITISTFFVWCHSETIYYKLVSIQGESTPKVLGGGQFITFTGDQCFESNINGVSVKNGKLEINRYQSNSLKTVYSGSSYWGNKTNFIFSKSKQNLEVVTNKLSYKYVKSTPPDGVSTCSLIRSKSDSGESTVPPISPIPSQNGYNNGYYNGGANNNSGSNSNSNSNSNVNTPARKFKCAYCNGTGRIEKNDNAPANFGIDRPRQRCNECGKWYDPNAFTHYHQQCRHCGGTGYSK